MNRSFFSILLAAALMLAVVSAAAGQNAGSGNLRNPAALKETSPATYKAKFDTTAGVFVIEVDGGIEPDTAPLVAAAGATLLVAGSAVYGHREGVEAGIQALRDAVDGR